MKKSLLALLGSSLPESTLSRSGPWRVSEATLPPFAGSRSMNIQIIRSSLRTACLSALALLSACGAGGGGSSNSHGFPGQEVAKPNGDGTFFVDPNQGGSASRLHLAEMFWARLVDVHD